MKRLVYTVALGATLSCFTAFAGSWTGVISESKCGAKHEDAPTNKASESCIKGCIKGGAEPVLVTDGKVVKIDKQSHAKVMDHLGHKVTVTGTLEGNTLTIDSVSM